MSQREEWNEYLYRVKEWMDDLEEYIYHSRVDVQSDEQEEAPMETELYRLKESWPESMEEDKEKLDYFIEQVGRTAKAYEQFQSGASVTTESRGETQDYVPPGEHRLPPLPYSYDALEPVISEEIMRLHHSEHHQSYVDGLNKAEEEMQRARETGDFELLRYWEREAAFNGAGHYLHTIFWNNMSLLAEENLVVSSEISLIETLAVSKDLKSILVKLQKRSRVLGGYLSVGATSQKT